MPTQGDASQHRTQKRRHDVRFNEQLEHPDGTLVFAHASKLGAEGIVSKRLGSRYRSGRSPDWLKFKNPSAPTAKREAEEDLGTVTWAGTIAGIVAAMILFGVEARGAGILKKDFPRYLLHKQFQDGVVVLSATDQGLEIDVQWADGADLDNLDEADLMVRIDDAEISRPKVLRSNTGLIYGYNLGAVNAILPSLSRGERMQILLPGKPERTVTLKSEMEKGQPRSWDGAIWTNWRRTQR
jgi:hypothetical protein